MVEPPRQDTRRALCRKAKALVADLVDEGDGQACVIHLGLISNYGSAHN